MKVLFVVWELAPFFQVGGLGDVARSLPKSLYSENIDIKVILPYYRSLKLHRLRKKLVNKISIVFNKKKETVSVYQIHFINSDLPIYLVKNENFLDLPNIDLFSFFDLAIIEILKKNTLSWQPQIIHCNDSHGGLIPLLIKHQNLPFKTILTIHNLTHQGKIPISSIEKIGFPIEKCRVVKWEIQRRQINRLLEGITHADLINTVSPSYAKEIMTEEYGASLEDILKNERQKIYGILNGIDNDSRSPLKNDDISAPFSVEKPTGDYGYGIFSPFEGKKRNKKSLQEKLGLTQSDKLPLIAFIGRFDSKQKGIELIHKMIRRINLNKFQFVILGQGESEWEERFNWLASFYQKSVAYVSIFDSRLASQIYAGADFILIPSKFEPCGLIQMIAMRYGTLPIARATGGLKDSIKNGVDGFLFNKYTSNDLEKTLKKAVDIMNNDRSRFKKMVLAAMTKNFSWEKSAQEYIKLYNKLLDD